jgi:putative MATE family efflux protein
LAIAAVINIILDPLFILGIGPIPAMGIAGVAYATVIAQAISVVFGLIYLFKKAKIATWDRSLIKPDGFILKQLITIGTPAGIQQALVSIAMLFLSSLVNRNGEIVVAAYGLGGRIDQFAFMPAQSVALAVSALVAQNLGANKPERVREVWRYSNLLTTAIAASITVAIWFFPDFWARIFTTDLAVREMTVTYLRIVSLSYVVYSLMFTTGGLCRGAGDTFIAMGVSLLSLWLIRLPLATFLSNTMQMGPRGIFLGIAISPVVGLGLNHLYYRSGRWQKRNLTTQRRSSLQGVEE